MADYQKFVFTLKVEDGWPPVAKEGLVFSKVEGGFRLEVAPLFVKDLSVGDVLDLKAADADQVLSWKHVSASRRSTVWVMDFGDRELPNVLAELKGMGCNLERLNSFNYVAVDVPESASAELVMQCLDRLDEESAPVAYPSWRHEDE